MRPVQLQRLPGTGSQAPVTYAFRAAPNLTACISTDSKGNSVMSDGKTSRQVWKQGDGNGDPNPELIEKNRNKNSGHPTWRVYVGNIPNPAQKGSEEPPRWVYLDDRAAYDILKQNVYKPHERHRFWPFDFTSRGQIPSVRPNRGRPALLNNSTMIIASVPKRGGDMYCLCGSYRDLVVIAGGASSTTTTSSNVATTKTSVSAGPPSNPRPTEKSKGTGPVVAQPLNISSKPPVPEHQPSPPHVPTLASEGGTAPKDVLPANGDAPAKGDTTLKLDAPPKLNGPAKCEITHKLNASPKEDASLKGVASEGNNQGTHKRRRLSITPYVLPSDLRAYDDENTRLRNELERVTADNTSLRKQHEAEKATVASQHLIAQCASRQAQTALQTRYDTLAHSVNIQRVNALERERDAFRGLARALYAHKVDQQNALAERYRALHGLMGTLEGERMRVEALVAQARRELGPVGVLHGDVDRMLDEQGDRFHKAGLGKTWDKFVDEAMKL